MRNSNLWIVNFYVFYLERGNDKKNIFRKPKRRARQADDLKKKEMKKTRFIPIVLLRLFRV